MLSTVTHSLKLGTPMGQTTATWCSFIWGTSPHMTQASLSPKATHHTDRPSLTPKVENLYAANLMLPKVANCNTVNLHMCAKSAIVATALPLIRTTTLLDQAQQTITLLMNSPPPVSPPPLLKHAAAWESCLNEDNDKDFIVHGIRHGFSLIKSDVDIDDIAPTQVTNNLSTRSRLIQPIISEEITDELLSGGYVKCSDEPKLIGALLAIPKPDGGIRLIHDLSRPNEQSVNFYATKDYRKYETINDALSLIQPGWFMAVVDLKSAYCSVHIPPAEHAITGLKWRFTNQSESLIMCDTCLPFGVRKSLAIFNRITQAVARSLRRDGHHVVVYLGNFFVGGPYFDSFKATFGALITLLGGLGFKLAVRKLSIHANG